MLGLFALIGLCLLATIGLATLLFPGELRDQRFALPVPQFPAPQLQTSPRGDMRSFYAAEMKRLESVGWQDKAKGRVHIPIEQAMRKVAEEGIEGWAK